MSVLRRSAVVIAAAVLATGIAGCSKTVPLKPAADANNPLCANVMVNLPKTLAANETGVLLDRQWTDAQSTAAWGDPTSVYLRCGVDVPAASTLVCAPFAGFDWLVDDSEAPWMRMTTFGRKPAVQVYFNSNVLGSTDLLTRIGKASQDLTKTGQCTDRPGS